MNRYILFGQTRQQVEIVVGKHYPRLKSGDYGYMKIHVEKIDTDYNFVLAIYNQPKDEYKLFYGDEEQDLKMAFYDYINSLLSSRQERIYLVKKNDLPHFGQSSEMYCEYINIYPERYLLRKEIITEESQDEEIATVLDIVNQNTLLRLHSLFKK